MSSIGSATAAVRHATAAAPASGEGGESTAGRAAAAGFGEALERALSDTVRTAKEADAKAMAALTGAADITDVVTAVARAELALQTTIAIRDRVIQAYQDVMRMPI